MSEHPQDCACRGTGLVLKSERAWKHHDPGQDEWNRARGADGRWTGETVECRAYDAAKEESK